MLKITNKWWPLTTLNRWPLYRIKIYSKMHWESTKVTVMTRWPLGQVWLYFYSGVLYNCNLLTLQISIMSIFFNKQSFTLMLHFIYFIYLHLIHLCCKLSVILISPVIPLLIVASGYVKRTTQSVAYPLA